MKNLLIIVSILISIHVCAQNKSGIFFDKGMQKVYGKNNPDYDGAVKLFTKTIELDPKMLEAIIERGKAYSHIPEYKKAIADFSNAIQTLSDTINGDEEELSMVYYYRGSSYFRINDFLNALADLSNAKRCGYLDGDLFFMRAIAFENLLEYDDAIKDFQCALPYFQNKKDTAHVFEAYNKIGMIENNRNHIEVAIRNLTEALELRPNDISCLKTLANCYFLKRLYGKAFADYDLLTKINAFDFSSVYLKGYLNYFFLEKRSEAKRNFIWILSFDNSNYYRPYIYVILNEPMQLKESLDSKRREGDNYFKNPEYWYHLSCIYSLKFQTDNAVSCLDTALRLGFLDFERIKDRDPGLLNIRYKQGFTNLLAKYKIPDDIKKPANWVLQKIDQNEKLSKALPHLSIKLSFQSNSGSDILHGKENGWLIAEVHNSGEGTGWNITVQLNDDKNGRKINYEPSLVIDKISPHQKIEKRFTLLPSRRISGMIHFKAFIQDENGYRLDSTTIDIIAKPQLKLEDALLMNADSVSYLDMSGGNYTYLPYELSYFKHIQYLNLSNNNLDTIDFTKLPSTLKFLDLSENKIEVIPDQIIKLQNLTDLDLSNNKIHKIPANIDPELKLRKISLKNNKLERFEPALLNCSNLEELNLSGNPIKEIPENISVLEKLRILSINSCDIRKCSDNFYKLKNIQTINVMNNNYFSMEYIADVRISLPDATEISYSDPVTKDTLLMDPLYITDIHNFDELLTQYKSGNSTSMTVFGDYFDFHNQSNLARIMYKKSIKYSTPTYYNVFLETANYIDNKGYPDIAELAYQKTLDFPIENYRDRMEVAYELYNHNYPDIAYLHYKKVVEEYPMLTDTTLKLIARFLENNRGLYDLAITAFITISLKPENAGRGKGLNALQAVAEILERHNELMYPKSVLDCYKEICNTIPLDEVGLKIVQSSCRKCYDILTKEINKKQRRLDHKQLTLRHLNNASTATQRTGLMSGLVGSFVPGAGTVASAVQTGTSIANIVEESSYNKISHEADLLYN